MKALAIKQPWAWMIIRPDLTGVMARKIATASGEIKDLENRTWHTNFRGRFLVHASKGLTRQEYWTAYDFAVHLGVIAPPMEELQRGGIIGSVELVDSVDDSDSDWYMGEKGFVLRDPRPLPFIPLKGQLGFFDVPDEVLPCMS
ncbi:hypothetical protein [Pseudomonas putida]|uniref:ASCH domain-containing protein n=1 Tax=Pseudomonas putida TaxID=303 RepID=A0A1L7NQ22_PSEPU|nr:hypothetical protein [Pseudomonas putida]BAW27543.1 ASCH domain-containing protein [Pseudomonas putida]